MNSILIVDDEKDIRDNLAELLKDYGYEVYTADSAQSASEMINNTKIDLVILDIMMPAENGLDFCKRLYQDKRINIIIASASNDEFDQVLAYEFGAKDYISKPFNKKLLLAKIKSTINNELPSTRYIVFDQILFDTLEKTVCTPKGVTFNLNLNEHNLLLALSNNKFQFISREILFQIIYNRPYDGLSRNIDVLISKIRKKINDVDKTIILTSFQHGYTLNKDIYKHVKNPFLQ
jgi:two-component system OmpR family response regulator